MTLSDISLLAPARGLTCVYGPTGCGKSSLLSALLGDVGCLAGRARVGGTVSYCPQKAWVQNATLRENILFGTRNWVDADDEDDERTRIMKRARVTEVAPTAAAVAEAAAAARAKTPPLRRKTTRRGRGTRRCCACAA